MDTLVNITACYDPVSGAKTRTNLAGILHARWIEEAVDHWRKHYPYEVAATLTGFPGLALVSGEERETYYRIFNKCKLLHTHQNPSHQIGASLTLKMGMEYAAYSGYTYLIHTAEDLIPRVDSIEAKMQAIQGCDFVGGIGKLDLASMPADQHKWINQKRSDPIGAGCQLFVCRAAKFAWSWDVGKCVDCIEIHMGNFIEDNCKYISLPEEYDHSHDYNVWKEWRDRYEQAVAK